MQYSDSVLILLLAVITDAKDRNIEEQVLWIEKDNFICRNIAIICCLNEKCMKVKILRFCQGRQYFNWQRSQFVSTYISIW